MNKALFICLFDHFITLSNISNSEICHDQPQIRAEARGVKPFMLADENDVNFPFVTNPL